MALCLVLPLKGSLKSEAVDSGEQIRAKWPSCFLNNNCVWKSSFKSESERILFQMPLVKKWKDVRYKRYEFSMFSEVYNSIKKDEDENQVNKLNYDILKVN